MLIVNNILHILISVCFFMELVKVNCERIDPSHIATTYMKQVRNDVTHQLYQTSGKSDITWQHIVQMPTFTQLKHNQNL